MKQLNIPQYPDLQTKIGPDGVTRIYDRLRMHWVALTPEEWVRQNFTCWLIYGKGYPKTLLANEVGIKLNGMTRRIDTIVFARDGRTPLCIVEYKSPDVSISAATFRQAPRYNIVMQAPLLIISNGLKHYCALVDAGNPVPRYLPQIPNYVELEAYSHRINVGIDGGSAK